MNRTSNKVLVLFIAVLVVTNIAVLAYFLWYKKDEMGEKPKETTELLKDQVGFSEEQLERYKVLRDKQRQLIKPMFDEMRQTRDSLFKILGDTSDAPLQLTGHLGQRQKNIDLVTFRHFSEVRTICEPGQLPAYDSMVVQMFRRFGKPNQQKKDKK